MNGWEAEDMAEIYKERDRREATSADATPEQCVAPLVGTGEMVVRPELHILLCDGKVRGWTDNREWAE